MEIKENLRGGVSSRADAVWGPLQVAIAQSANTIAGNILDETKLEEIARAAREGATFMAVRDLTLQLGQQALLDSQSILDELVQVLTSLVTRTFRDAILEVVEEEALKRLRDA